MMPGGFESTTLTFSSVQIGLPSFRRPATSWFTSSPVSLSFAMNASRTEGDGYSSCASRPSISTRDA